MKQDDLHDWRRAEKAALEAEAVVRSNIGMRNPRMRELKANAMKLRAEADGLLVKLTQRGEAPRLPEGVETGSVASLIAAWRRSEARAEAAQEGLVLAFTRYVAQGGPLP